MKAGTTSLVWCGWCRQSTTELDCAPSLSPALWSLHGRPGCSGSIDLPTSYHSLSLSPVADDEAYAYHHGGASSTSPGASLRPKRTLHRKRRRPYLALEITKSPQFSAQIFSNNTGFNCDIHNDLLSMKGAVFKTPSLVGGAGSS